MECFRRRVLPELPLGRLFLGRLSGTHLMVFQLDDVNQYLTI
jgi:hypothetical protein